MTIGTIVRVVGTVLGGGAAALILSTYFEPPLAERVAGWAGWGTYFERPLAEWVAGWVSEI